MSDWDAEILRIKELADEMLSHKSANSPLTFIHFQVNVPVLPVLWEFLDSSLSDLILQDGSDLSIPNGGDYYPPLPVKADYKLLGTSLNLTAWGMNYERDAAASWSRSIEISFWYGGNVAKQELSISTSGKQPAVSRSIVAPEYAESGYEGHNFMYRLCNTPEEARFFIDVAVALWGLRSG